MAGSLQMIFTGLLLLALCRVVPAIDDFTCVTKPRIDIYSEDTYIASYFVGSSRSLSFKRTTYTRTGTDHGKTPISIPGPLPSGSTTTKTTSSQGDAIVAILELPAGGTVTRIGAFACQARTTGDDVLSIETVIMSKTADFLPTHVSRAINRGEPVRLDVTATKYDSRTETRWRKDGGEPAIRMLSGRLDVYINNADEADGGIYEVYQAGERKSGKQALIQLIVRRCRQNEWNAPFCNRDCPVCFNGGVCDDRSGDCICPPGFGGYFCETPFGPNRFGQRGNLRCDGPGLGDVPTCEGKLFCLPDPYGCSCAAGYKGIDCDETCDDKSYGADCSQTCHCVGGVACNKSTGVCPGECAEDFTGINCKDRCLTINGNSSCNTTCTAPSAVEDLTTATANHDQLIVSWRPSRNTSSICQGSDYVVKVELLNLELCQLKRQNIETWITSTTAITIDGRKAYSKYSITVIPRNEAGDGASLTTCISMPENTPQAAPELDEVSITSTSVAITWHSLPCGKRGGNITGYIYELRDASGHLLETGKTTAQLVAFQGLSQGASFSLRLRAYTNVGPGPWRTAEMELDKGNMVSGRRFGSSAILPALGATVCLLLAVALTLLMVIIIRKRPSVENRNAEDKRADDTEATYANVEVYEATEYIKLQNIPSMSGHDPPALSSIPVSTDVSLKLSNATKPSTSTKRPVESKHDATTYKPTLKSSTKSQSAFPQAGSVALTHLALYIEGKKSGKISGFQQDFKSLPKEHLHSSTVARKEENKEKNRYHNIFPYDHSRVLLETSEHNPHSDYINASYINGYKQESRYIACQGPTVASVNDMWRMVWQERVGKIVMLTNLVENGKGKCNEYWPVVRSYYGDICVTNMNETEHCNFVVRTFHLSKSTSEPTDDHVVTQFHYTAWPDKKLPESSPLLQFIRMVQTYETSLRGPLVVHCSSGVGRTGTFIALDAMLEQAQAEGQVDVLSFVRDMREQRFLMVHTLDQYKFIFDALLESSLSENTAIPADRFQQDYDKLKKRNKKTGKNGIEDQFKMLETFTPAQSTDQCFDGRNSANVDKNRFQDCIPNDSGRPYLMTSGDEGSTNYINATFLDGYKGKNAYIATQAPLPNTVGDIWRMVFDYKSTCVVMLNSMDNDPTVAKYWPEDSLCCGPLTVKFQSEDRRSDNLVARQFVIHHPKKKSNEVQSVCQIQYLGWPAGKDVPDSAISLLEVLLEVRRWTDDHPDGPITVHCIDGVRCSGTFCTLITLLDRLKEDEVVDVFQAVKKLRTVRGGIIKTLDQYQFCYHVIQTFLDSSSIYENLR